MDGGGRGRGREGEEGQEGSGAGREHLQRGGASTSATYAKKVD